MNAVSLEEGTVRIVRRPEPRPGRGEAVIRVTTAGICGTDLEIARGFGGFRGTPGHEFVGVVESADEAGWVGRRVVGEINAACGVCPICRSGLPGHCPTRTVLGIHGRDGAFAEKLALPASNLHPVPPDVGDEAAVFTEPLAAAHEILLQVRPAAGAGALVLGDGRLGQLCAEVLARAGFPPVVCGRSRVKLRRLEQRGFRTVDAGTPLPREFDLVVEATGSPEGLKTALSVVRPRGTVVLKSTYHGEARFALSPLVIDEITVVGSRCGPFPVALQHLATDPAVTDGLVTASFPLLRAAEAFACAASSDSLKVLLVP